MPQHIYIVKIEIINGVEKQTRVKLADIVSEFNTVLGTSVGLITMGQPEGDNLASTGMTYISSSGRNFFSHSGTGTSTDACAFSFKPEGWLSGAKVWIDFATPQDGVNNVVYKVTVTVNNGGVEVSETITFTKVLSDDTANYEKLSTEKKTLSSTITDVLTPDSNVTIKVIRDAGHVDDNDNSTSFTEFINFDYNY